jgi:hypothetical protein
MYISSVMKPAKNIHFPYLHIIISFNSASIISIACSKKEVKQVLRERDFHHMLAPALGYLPTKRLIKTKRHRLWQMQNNAANLGKHWKPTQLKNWGVRIRTLRIDLLCPPNGIRWYRDPKRSLRYPHPV